jgi:hypothetical protein
MAAGGGGSTRQLIMKLVGGGILIAIAIGLHSAHLGPAWLTAVLEAVGGLAVVFGSCELMIKSVEGLAARAKWNDFVAGAIAGLASNIPEIVMLGFVIANEPRVGFIVVALTLHTGALAFGVYSCLLPRDETGHARLPAPMVQLSTDLYAGAAGVFVSTGALMLMVRSFSETKTAALNPTDLYVMGALLLMVQVVSIKRLISRFAGEEEGSEPATDDENDDELPSVGSIALYGVLGLIASVVGGHAVGSFAETLVTSLTAAGYSEMFGALLLSIFACAGAVAMIATAHKKGMYDVALANVSGWVTQMPFVVLPIVLIMLAAFGQLGIIPIIPGGGVLPIDLQTTSVFFLGFPPLLILWKAIQDDGAVNWVETATMVAVFALTIYFLAFR